MLRASLHRRIATTSTRRCSASFSTTSRRDAPKKRQDKFNYNQVSFGDVPDAQQLNFKRVTANDLEKSRSPPTEVKMLVRDFIEDSLYNPHYGYFPKQATIFTATDPIDFGAMRDSTEFQEEVAKRYQTFETGDEGPGRQIWHTPTELFKVRRAYLLCSTCMLKANSTLQPWYGQAIAQCLAAEYLLKYFPYEDFVIYEIGAGNGTLARNILDYLRDEHPEVYDRTRYNIIEISGSLAELQRKLLCEDHPCVKITHKSAFKWDAPEPSPCFFLAMEVIVSAR